MNGTETFLKRGGAHARRRQHVRASSDVPAILDRYRQTIPDQPDAFQSEPSARG